MDESPKIATKSSKYSPTLQELHDFHEEFDGPITLDEVFSASRTIISEWNVSPAAGIDTAHEHGGEICDAFGGGADMAVD